MAKKNDKEANRLDNAARAGWLYYVAGHNQDEVAVKLGVSRQAAQRLVSLAINEKLIKFRLDHPLAHCMELSQKLMDKFDLKECEVVPNDLNPATSFQGIPQACASAMEQFLKSDKPKIITLGTGRTLRACVDQLSQMDCPQHRIVSQVGNITPDGAASSYDVIIRMSDTINALRYPLPVPVIAASIDERKVLQAQRQYQHILALAEQTDVSFVGIGQMSKDAPLVQDGFITRNELKSIVNQGAVGEIIGWVFDKEGRIIAAPINDRVSSVPIIPDSKKIVFGVAAGKSKINAIFSALQGKLINSLVTNEYTAEQLLKKRINNHDISN